MERQPAGFFAGAYQSAVHMVGGVTSADKRFVMQKAIAHEKEEIQKEIRIHDAHINEIKECNKLDNDNLMREL